MPSLRRWYMNLEKFKELYKEGYGEEGISKRLRITVHGARKIIKSLGLKKHPFSRKGIPLRKDVRKKIAQKHKGKKLSSSHKESISRGLIGKMVGNKNPGWKGGMVMKEGYVFIRKPDHHRAWYGGYAKRADLVAEKLIGRKLKKGEIVHHLNGLRHDDNPKNLSVAKNSSYHNSITAKERWERGDFRKILPRIKRIKGGYHGY